MSIHQLHPLSACSNLRKVGFARLMSLTAHQDENNKKTRRLLLAITALAFSWTSLPAIAFADPPSASTSSTTSIIVDSDKPCPNFYINKKTYSDGSTLCQKATTGSAATTHGPSKLVKKPSAKKIKANKAKRAAENSDQQADATPAVAPSINPPVVTTSVQASTVDIAPDPIGDIYVVTYVDKPDVNTANDHDARIGGVDIKIERQGGNEHCLIHPNNKGKTFRLQNRKGRDGKMHVVKGSIHFASCNAKPGSTYTVTALGRKGYKVISTNPKVVNLSNGENARVPFVLQKLPKR